MFGASRVGIRKYALHRYMWSRRVCDGEVACASVGGHGAGGDGGSACRDGGSVRVTSAGAPALL